MAALPLDYDLSVVVVMPSVVVVAITAHDDGPVAVAMIFGMGADDLSVAVPMAADPHVQVLGKRRRRNAEGRTGGYQESNLAHFQTPQLFFRFTIPCALHCSVAGWR
jgi:hypothetical protein